MFRQKHTVSVAHCLCVSVLSTLVLVTGCAPIADSKEKTTSRPPATASSSREEAQVLATTAYEGFLALSDEIAKQGGAGSERLSEVARGDALVSISESMHELEARGLRITGSTTFTLVEVSEWDHDLIRAYVCEDVGLIDLLDAQGKSLVSPDRVAVTPFEIELERDHGSPFLLSERQVWAGQNFCH